MAKYKLKGFTISCCGYHQPDHCVWWEAVDDSGCAFFHGTALREVEFMILDSEWEDKLKAKDREIAELRERIKIAEDALERIDNMCDGDMCKFFDDTHHCSACRYLDGCQTGVAHAALYEIREKGTKIYTPQVKKAEQGVLI